MIYFILISLLLSGCAQKSFELEQISADVLKNKQGVEIDVKPLPKQ